MQLLACIVCLIRLPIWKTVLKGQSILVEKSEITEIDEEIMLISANHDVRESSMEVKRWEVSRLKELYEAKKIKGEIKNINAEIAKQLNISERQARNCRSS